MVEGPDDKHVVMHICGTRGLGKIDLIHPYGGKDPLLDGIRVRLLESEIAALGILLDADEDLEARWQAISSRLSDAGYSEVPATSARDGAVIDAPRSTLLPRVGVWLMPNNQVPGILEDFLSFLVPSGDPLLERASDCIDAIAHGQRPFSDLKRPKALIHTWLAWQQEPGKPFGQAITARYLDPNLPTADLFADWLCRTFFTA